MLPWLLWKVYKQKEGKELEGKEEKAPPAEGAGVNYSHTLGVNLGVTPVEHPWIWAELTFSLVESTVLQMVAPLERPKAG